VNLFLNVCQSSLASGLTDVFSWEVLAAKFGHPKGCSQNKDCQARCSLFTSFTRREAPSRLQTDVGVRYFGWAHFISINSVFAGREAIADELNPLTISHTARTISCTAIGRFKTIWTVEKDPMRPNITNMLATRPNVAPTRPHPDNYRGMSFD
jgi:hypothetical protein